MTFDQWWAKNAPRYYVSDPPPKKGWMVDVARDAWNAALEQRSARDFAPSETDAMPNGNFSRGELHALIDYHDNEESAAEVMGFVDAVKYHEKRRKHYAVMLKTLNEAGEANG